MLSREEAFLDAQQLNVPDVDVLHGEQQVDAGGWRLVSCEAGRLSEEEKTGRKRDAFTDG